PGEELGDAGHERDRAAAERASVEPRDLAAPVLDGEGRRVGVERGAELRPPTDTPNAALDPAVARLRVHARARGDALAVDLELGLLRLVAEQRELLEARLETERGEGLGD